MIPSIVVYICLATARFEIISSKGKGNSTDVLSNFKISTSVGLGRISVLAKYLEYGGRKTPLPDRSKRYIKDLGNDIKQNGLKNPIILAISKKNRTSIFVYEGNQRMAALLDSNVNWVLLMVNYFFLNGDDETHPRFVPRTVNANRPSNPKPSNFGFKTRPI